MVIIVLSLMWNEEVDQGHSSPSVTKAYTGHCVEQGQLTL